MRYFYLRRLSLSLSPSLSLSLPPGRPVQLSPSPSSLPRYVGIVIILPPIFPSPFFDARTDAVARTAAAAKFAKTKDRETSLRRR